MVLAAGLLIAGCASPIPITVQPVEYEVYSQWLTKRFQTERPPILYISSVTMPFPSHDPCRKQLAANGVSRTLVGALSDLSAERFPLDRGESSLKVPNEYKFSPSIPWEDKRSLRYVSFSRVAFDSTGSRGLFAFNDSFCEDGVCGGGGSAVLASKTNGHWEFQVAGCVVSQ